MIDTETAQAEPVLQRPLGLAAVTGGRTEPAATCLCARPAGRPCAPWCDTVYPED